MRRKTGTDELIGWEEARAEAAEKLALARIKERDQAVRVAAHLANRLGLEEQYTRTKVEGFDMWREFSPAAYEADLAKVRQADEAVSARKRLGLDKAVTDAG